MNPIKALSAHVRINKLVAWVRYNKGGVRGRIGPRRLFPQATADLSKRWGRAGYYS